MQQLTIVNELHDSENLINKNAWKEKHYGHFNREFPIRVSSSKVEYYHRINP